MMKRRTTTTTTMMVMIMAMMMMLMIMMMLMLLLLAAAADDDDVDDDDVDVDDDDVVFAGDVPPFKTFQYLHRHRSRRVNVMPSNCSYKQLTTQKSSQAVILNFDSEPAQERRTLHVLVGSYRLDFFHMAPVSIMHTQKTGLQGRL